MHRRVTGACAILLIVVVAPAEARSRLDPPDVADYVRWGPLRARPLLELSDIGYDDNILASTRNPVGDYTATLSPALEGLMLFGSRAFFEFRERLELTGYLHNTDQSFANQRGKGRITLPLGNYGFFGDIRLDRVHEQPLDLDDIRPARDERALGAGFVVRPGSRTEIELRRSDARLRYTDPDFDSLGQSIGQRLDRDVSRLALAADYRIVGRTRLTLDAATQQMDFSDLDPAGRRKDSRGWSAAPGVNFGERGALSGSARLGWAAIDAEDPTIADFSGLVGGAELNYRPIPRATASLGWTREPAFSIYEDAVYLLDQSLRLGGLYYLVWPVGIEAGVRRGRLSFPSGGSDRVDIIAAYELGVRLRLAQTRAGRRLEYSLKLRRSETDSNVEGFDRERTTLGVNVVLGY